MKINNGKYTNRILTSIATIFLALEMKADGHDRIIPISDDGMLFIQIALVMAAIGLVFLLASLLGRLVRKRNLPEPKSYLLIVLITLFVAWFWNWIAREMNLLADIADLAIGPITILLLFFIPMLLYRISPKKKSSDSKKISGETD